MSRLITVMLQVVMSQYLSLEYQDLPGLYIPQRHIITIASDYTIRISQPLSLVLFYDDDVNVNKVEKIYILRGGGFMRITHDKIYLEAIIENKRKYYVFTGTKKIKTTLP
jgi:hypothetical protein